MPSRDSRPTLQWLIVALLGLWGYRTQGGSTGPPGEQLAGSTTEAQSVGQQQVTEDALAPLRTFLSVGPNDDVATDLNKSHRNVRCLLATVPDPNDSHLPGEFDRVIGTLQRALEDSSYVLVGWQLPWRPNDPPVRTAESTSAPLLEMPSLGQRMPGTLLFQSTTAPRDLVVLFLVGETPTAGVHPRSLAEALAKANSLQLDHAPTFHVLGPTFSGSAPSLRAGLGRWSAVHPSRFKVITGSASNDAVALRMRTAPGALAASGEPCPSIDFSATVHPDSVLVDEFTRYLRTRLGADPALETALLVESGTVYGQRNATTVDSTPSVAECELGTDRIFYPEGSSIESIHPRLLLRFPLHVSQLRAYSQSQHFAPTPSSAAQPPKLFLELSQEAPQFPRDILPALSPTLTANLTDLSIATAVDLVRRAGIHYVGIQASDSRDVLYLTRRFHAAAADLTFFTFGADRVFTHPDYSAAVRGMIVVSTYPLLPFGHTRGGEGSRELFSSSAQEGIYNATLLQLHYMGVASAARLTDYSFDSPRADPTQHVQVPPVWLTIIGRDDFEGLESRLAPTRRYLVSAPAALGLGYSRFACHAVVAARVAYRDLVRGDSDLHFVHARLGCSRSVFQKLSWPKSPVWGLYCRPCPPSTRRRRCQSLRGHQNRISRPRRPRSGKYAFAESKRWRYSGGQSRPVASYHRCCKATRPRRQRGSREPILQRSRNRTVVPARRPSDSSLRPHRVNGDRCKRGLALACDDPDYPPGHSSVSSDWLVTLHGVYRDGRHATATGRFPVVPSGRNPSANWAPSGPDRHRCTLGMARSRVQPGPPLSHCDHAC